MQSLLSRTNVIQLFKNPSVSRSQSKVFTNNSFVSPKSKPSLIINTDLAVERNCEKVIKAHTLESSTVSRKLQENLKNQYDRLDQRLFFRKQSTPKVVIKTQRFEEMNQCDISAGEAKVNPIEEFEKDVEEKIKIKEKIEKDYQEYFIESKSMKGEMAERLAQQLEKNMKEEIEDEIVRMNDRRNNEIKAARNIFNQKSLN